MQVDQQVYRGAQPTGEGFRYFAGLGIKVVLDLRENDGRALAEERAVTAAGMRYVNVPMTGKTPPTMTETNKILALLEDSGAGPVFVHCKRGADRTGAVVAAYRIDHDKVGQPAGPEGSVVKLHAFSSIRTEKLHPHLSGSNRERQRRNADSQDRNALIPSPKTSRD